MIPTCLFSGALLSPSSVVDVRSPSGVPFLWSGRPRSRDLKVGGRDTLCLKTTNSVD